jgi:hypothetical protein
MKDRHAPVNRRTKCVQGAEQRGERPANFFFAGSFSPPAHTLLPRLRGHGGHIRKVL